MNKVETKKMAETKKQTTKQTSTKKVKKTMTKLEKCIFALMVFMVTLTPIIALTISSMNLVLVKEIALIEDELVVVRQESTELEVKKQEQLSYDEVDQYAKAGGLEKNEERVRKVSVN